MAKSKPVIPEPCTCTTETMRLIGTTGIMFKCDKHDSLHNTKTGTRNKLPEVKTNNK